MPYREADNQLTWSATINGRAVADVDSNKPLVLTSEEATHIELQLTNGGSTTVKLRSVRLEGRVMSMTFFRYTTRLDVELEPGVSTSREFDVELDDLTGQAVGLIPAGFQLIGDNRAVLDEETFPVDVKGSFTSVYGVFGLAVAGITAILLISLLVAIARRRLSRNRWRRASRFMVCGTGLGLTLTFTLSATRLLSPSAAAWLSLVATFGAVAFGLGYLLPLGVPPAEIDAGEADTHEDLVDAGPRHASTDGDPWP